MTNIQAEYEITTSLSTYVINMLKVYRQTHDLPFAWLVEQASYYGKRHQQVTFIRGSLWSVIQSYLTLKHITDYHVICQQGVFTIVFVQADKEHYLRFYPLNKKKAYELLTHDPVLCKNILKEVEPIRCYPTENEN